MQNDFSSAASSGAGAGPGPGASQEQRFQALFQQAPVSIQILAPDGRTLGVNKAWETLFQIHEGSPLKELFLSGALNVLTDPQLVASGVTGYLRRALAGESVEIPPIRFDTALLGGVAHVRWIRARAHPIIDERGTVVEVMLMHEDITEQVEAETALRLREERFRSLVMATSQIVWTGAPDGRVREDSPSWRAFTGQSYEEGRDFGWLAAIHPDDRERARDLWQASVASRTEFATEYRVRRADGAWRWTAVKSVPILDPNGAVREWIGANTDIHEKVMALAELAQRLDLEKRNSALLDKLARASRTLHTALSSKDIASALVEEVRLILGVRHAGVSLSEGPHVRQAIKAVSRADDGAEPAPMRARLAVPLVDRKGRNIGLIEAWDKQGGFTEEDEAILAQLASIAANGFENAGLYGSLQEQDRRKDEFLAMLAQELRHPLEPISKAMATLQSAHAADARVLEAGQEIGRQVQHLGALVDDLLDVSRVTRGQIQLERSRVEVAGIVAAAVEQVRPAAGARAHALVVEQEEDGPGRGPAVIGDARRLVQVLVSLLDNAIRYTPPGGRILLSVMRQAPAVRIAVRDDGVGIEPRLLPHVFELFTRAERMPGSIQGGLGIGLALVHNIVMLHGGTVSAYSQGPGKGSVFTVNLATAPD
ncbi:PAS domain S-box protein [Massilia sp. 2TAF26]|uniref:sensor histidine kinase n=1 Tax=Massilia sp. 2TAF26 TaxID=3233012 RepID=UPI003F979009